MLLTPDVRRKTRELRPVGNLHPDRLLNNGQKRSRQRDLLPVENIVENQSPPQLTWTRANYFVDWNDCVIADRDDRPTAIRKHPNVAKIERSDPFVGARKGLRRFQL